MGFSVAWAALYRAGRAVAREWRYSSPVKPSSGTIMPLPFAERLNNVETSAIRELFKLLGKPGI
ncbi:MAG: hypothetical protein EPN79_13335, partial [Burkholderiaceae bacterium]